MNNIKQVKINKDHRIFNIRLTRRELVDLLILSSMGHLINVRSEKECDELHAKLKHYLALIDLNDRGNEQ